MRIRIPHTLSALLAASAVSLACAQAAPAAVPAPAASTDPVASASRSEGPNLEITKLIVEQLIADPAMKGSKVTVQPEGDMITLTGVATNGDQKKRAAEIATALAGEGKVVNAIVPGDV